MTDSNTFDTIDSVTVLEYLNDQRISPFEKWFNKLDVQAAAKISIHLYRMKQGNFSNVKNVGSGVCEKKINHGPGYRIYFGRAGSRCLILLGGGTKQSQANDIKLAKQCWGDYKYKVRMKNAIDQTV